MTSVKAPNAASCVLESHHLPAGERPVLVPRKCIGAGGSGRQDSHFISPQSIQKMLEAQVQVSMDGQGSPMDNIFTERWWPVKYKDVFLHGYDSPREARQGLEKYLDFYIFERLHQALDYRTPEEVHFQARNS